MTHIARILLVCVALSVALSTESVSNWSYRKMLKLPRINTIPIQTRIPSMITASSSSLPDLDNEKKGGTSIDIPKVQPSMLKINTLMLLFYSTLGAVMPYIPLYYRKLGVTDAQIGILGAITPAVTFIVSPLWGALADSTGSHKSIMMLTFVGSVLSRCLMGIVDKNVILLGIIVAISAVLFAPVKPLLDSAVLSSLVDKTTYGKSRLFGQIGFGVGSFMVGPFLSGHIKLMYAVQALLALPTLLLMSTIPSTPKIVNNVTTTGTAADTTSTTTATNTAANTATSTSNSNHNSATTSTTTAVTAVAKLEEEKRMKKLNSVLKQPTVLLFFFAIFLIGLSSGIIENFAYVKISEVSGTGTRALTVSRLLSSLAGGPMFWLSGDIIKYIGTRAVLTLTILTYVVRFLNYASITRGWHAIPAEILRGVTFALFWSAATTHVYDISPTGLSATMLGLLNGIYGGLGQSIGSLIGGELVRSAGISAAFYKCAAVDGVLLLAFLGYQLWSTAQRAQVAGIVVSPSSPIQQQPPVPPLLGSAPSVLQGEYSTAAVVVAGSQQDSSVINTHLQQSGDQWVLGADGQLCPAEVQHTEEQHCTPPPPPGSIATSKAA